MTAVNLQATVEAPIAPLSHPAASLSVSISPLPAMDQLEAVWRGLEGHADGSFFTSWSWIGAWLAVGTHKPPLLVEARAGSQVVGLAMLSRSRRPGLWPRGVLALNRQTGADDDALYIEYNDMLVDRGGGGSVRQAMVQAVARYAGRAIDEIEIAAATPDAAAALATLGWPIERQSRECPWVDLPLCGYGLEGYLAVLSRNTRAQVRRALRLAGQGLGLQRARTPGERTDALEELRRLHQAYWTSKGKPGAFAAPRFAAFATALLPCPDVELLRITAAGGTLGVLLNFVHGGHVYAYQSGFSYEGDNRLKPGLVSHVLAIADSARLGRTAYHFMAGEARYKDSLGTSVETLTWLTARRPGLVTAGLLRWRSAKTLIRTIISGT